MPESQQRIQRIAVGLAVAAMLVALLAVFVVATRRPSEPRAGVPASRRVAVDDLVKLTPEALQGVGDGVRVIDDALRTSLGLAREDTIVAISGLRVTSAGQLSRMLGDLGAFTPTSLFVELVRDRAPVLERWELDGDLAVAAHPGAGHGGPRTGHPPSVPPLDPLIVTVRQIDRTTYEVPRSTVEAWTARPERVAAGGSVLSHPDGIRILAIRPGSILEALGIQNGDLIRGINGVELGPLQRVIEIIAGSTRRITIDLWRGGQTIILNYLIP
ncbi:MAG TPA: PDZ domain-containing protein [Kofleriaceae bacterium]|jgi:S1-C subfamily serine protease|nr:PDZ domain-containing protein [Kofleriaceae bacterium]